MQTFLAKRVVSAFSEGIDGSIKIDRVHLVFLNKVILEDLSITSHQGDTLIGVEKLSVSFSPTDLMRLKFSINRVRLENGVFNVTMIDRENTNLAAIFKLEKKEKKGSKESRIEMIAKEVRLKNFRFAYKNDFPKKERRKPRIYDPEIISFDDMYLTNINARINRVSFKEGVIKGRIQKMSFMEKSGFTVDEFKAEMFLSSSGSGFTNVFIKESSSTILADYINFEYNSIAELSDFTAKVGMKGNFKDSFLHFNTLGRMAPELKGNNLAIYFTGIIEGPVANLKTSSLSVRNEKGSTMLSLSAALRGLPDSDQTMMSIGIDKCRTIGVDIADIIGYFSDSDNGNLFNELSPNVVYNFKGSLDGLLTNFVINGKMHSNIGDIDVDLLLNSGSKSDGTSFDGYLSSLDFNVGKLLSNDLIGELSLESNFSAAFNSVQAKGTRVKVDSIKISKLGLNGYNYSNIFATGEYSGNIFDGRVICHDPNLDLIFQGVLSFPGVGDIRKYNFYANIPFADLTALNIDKRESRSRINTTVTADFTQYGKHDLFGSVVLKDLNLKKDDESYMLGDIELTSTTLDSIYHIDLISPFIKGSYNATASISSFLNRLESFAVNAGFGSLFKQKSFPVSDPTHRFGLNIETYDMRSICDFFFPGLYIADSTVFKTSVQSDTIVNMLLTSKRVAFGTNFIKDIKVEISNLGSELDGKITAGRVELSELYANNNIITLKGEEGLLDLNYSFANNEGDSTYLDLSSILHFDRDERDKTVTIFDVKDSDFTFHGNKWHFSPSSIKLSNQYLDIDNFDIKSKDQSININGIVSENRYDSLQLAIRNFDISQINYILPRDYSLDGLFSGDISLSDFYGNVELLMDISGKSIRLLNNQIGDISLRNEWNQIERRFDISLENQFNETVPLKIAGYYKPEEKYIDLKTSFSDFGLIVIEPLLKDLISETNGSLSGDIELYGPFDKLNLVSNNTFLNNFGFTLDFTKVAYTLNGGVELNENGVSFRNMQIRDRNNNYGSVTGGISHNHFKDLNFNTRISFANMHVLNTGENDNNAFYGNAYGSGNVSISGPLEKLLLDISATPQRNTALHIPLSNYAEASQTNLLTFISAGDTLYNEEDTYRSVISKNIAKAQGSKLSVKLNADVDNQSEVFIEINKQLGDVIRARGNGNIRIEVNPAENLFDIKGNYTVEEGSYRFVIFGFGTRDFTIEDGGVINFNGDIMSSTLNLTANYRTKALLSPLVSTSSDESDYSMRRNVDCSILLSGPLSNPQLSFAIDVPDLNPSTKAQINSALGTEDKILRQFMALLVSGSFIPDDQTGGIVNNSTLLYSNASDIVTNQLNNIFKQLGVPLDLGFNYQPDGSGERDIFDVAISTQLFNNRVIINGSLGYAQNYTSGASDNNEIAGDVDMEIKLGKRGKMRLNLFTHSADRYSNYLDNTQRNGAGLVYQDEFSTFKELWRNLFWSKKRRERYEAEMMRRIEQEMLGEPQLIDSSAISVNP